jgi:hypothetical protein
MGSSTHELETAIAAGLAGLAGSPPLALAFERAAKNGRGHLTFTARFALSARPALEAAIVQRPLIRGFVVEDMRLERSDGEVLVAGTVAIPAEEPAEPG